MCISVCAGVEMRAAAGWLLSLRSNRDGRSKEKKKEENRRTAVVLSNACRRSTQHSRGSVRAVACVRLYSLFRMCVKRSLDAKAIVAWGTTRRSEAPGAASTDAHACTSPFPHSYPLLLLSQCKCFFFTIRRGNGSKPTFVPCT